MVAAAYFCDSLAMNDVGMGPGTPCTVCVIDDDEGIRRSLARLLRANGVPAVCYDSAEAFLEQRQTCSRAVIDIQLPGLGGFELLDRLVAADPDVRAVLITGRPRDGIRSDGLKRGASAVLAKPFGERELFAALDLALADS